MGFIGLYVRVLGRLGPQKWLAIGLVVANVALAVSQFAEPMLFGKIIDQLTRTQSAGFTLSWAGIGPWLAAWAAFGIFSIIASVTTALHSDRLAHRRRVVEMAAYFDHVLHLPMSFHASAHTGRLLKIMIEGASGMFGVWLSFFREHFAALVSLGVLLPATLIVNWRLGGILLILVIVLGVLMNVVLRKTEVMQTAADVYSNDLAERVSDVLGNMPAIQSFARADEETSALNRLIDRMLNAQMPVLTWWAFASVATRSSSTLALVSILVTGVWLLMQNLTTVGQIVAFMSLSQMLIGRLEQTVAFANYMLSQSPRIRMFFDVLDTKPDVGDAPDAVAVGRLVGDVRFEDGVVRLRQGARGALGREFRSEGRPDDRARRLDRVGQVDHAQPPASGVRSDRRADHHRRTRHPHDDARILARKHRRGVPGAVHLRPLDRGEPAHRQARRDRGRNGAGARGGAGDRLRPPIPERPQGRDRRARTQSFGRRAAAAFRSRAR